MAQEKLNTEKKMFEPTETDLQWARNVLALLADGGTLAMPSPQLIYTVDKVQKILTLQNPEMLVFPDSAETHARTIIVFGQLGYSVEIL